MMNKVGRLYIHFPFCRHLCSYCDFYKEIRESGFQFESFHDYLHQSLIAHNKLLVENNFLWQPLKSLYIGGGTPSLWKDGPSVLDDFFKKQNIKFAEDYEFTYELNPGTRDLENLQNWIKFGLNRVSVGLQSLDQRYLPILDRIHTTQDSLATMQSLRERKINYSVDFMIGLPNLGFKRDIRAELKMAIDYGPSHFSVYILTTGKKHLGGKELPGDKQVNEEFDLVAKTLKSEGFLHYEVSNFSLAGKEANHNQAYWRGESVAAFGPSAVGFLKLGRENLRPSSALRYKWTPNKAEFVLEKLNEGELCLEAIYLGMRTNEGFNFQQLALDTESLEKLNNVMNKWEKSNLGFRNNLNKLHFTLNSDGFIILDNFMSDLFWVSKSLRFG